MKRQGTGYWCGYGIITLKPIDNKLCVHCTRTLLIVWKKQVFIVSSEMRVGGSRSGKKEVTVVVVAVVLNAYYYHLAPSPPHILSFSGFRTTLAFSSHSIYTRFFFCHSSPFILLFPRSFFRVNILPFG